MILLLTIIGLALVYSKFTGLIAATYTPFNDDFTLNLNVIEDHAKYLNKTGVSGVFIGGTTGEGLSLTLEERKKLADKWITIGHKHGLKVIIHVGSDSLIEGRELAEYSELKGADGISAMGTVFFKPSTPQSLVDCMKYLADGAPNTPFLYYHLPSMTGINVNVVTFFELAFEQIDSFSGIKFSDAILNDITAIQSYIKGLNNSRADDLTILFGRDEQYDSALYMGVDGGVGSTYSYAANIYNHIIKEFQKQNFTGSRLWQSRSELFIRTFSYYASNNVNSHKYLCELTTNIKFGPPRLPYIEMSEEMKQIMKEEFTEMGYFDWIKE